MFWTNMVHPPKIHRADMDGTEAISLFSTAISSPGALTVDPKTSMLFWTDTVLKRIETSDLVGGNRRVLAKDQILQPIGLAVLSDYLYWIDKETQYIERMNKTNGSNRMKVQGRVNLLSGIVSIRNRSMGDFRKHPCYDNNGKCSHICVTEDSGTPRCSCPLGLQLTGNELTCAEPPTCGADQFTCLSGSLGCIPSLWRCDGYPECEDNSDELDCPDCTAPDQFRCNNGQCIKHEERCDGIPQCKDASDEAQCCTKDQFQCKKSKRCIDKSLKCNSYKECQDEEECGKSAEVGAHHSPKDPNPTTYMLGIGLGMLFIVIVVVVVLFACRRKSQHMTLEDSRDIIMVTKPLNPHSDTTPPHTLSSRGKSGTTCLSLSTAHSSSGPPLYDRNHVTGASSSSSSVTHYPRETLNPPPSPVTDRSQCMGDLCYYVSQSPPSTVRSYGGHNRHYKRHIPPPPTTPCSTDVCEDSEPYTSKKYYLSELGYDSDPYPPPPTPRSHYFSDEFSCPPSPSTVRSYFNPYPPPPSPVGHSDC